MRRTFRRDGMAVEPPRRHTKADKDGWLTLKINLNAPLDECERAIRWHLRVNRVDPPKTRNRPDKIVEALEAWDCYEKAKQFSAVAQKLRRPVSTVKGQYVRACVLIHGQRPNGSIKQRRAGIVGDPAGEFKTHLESCSRCQKANTGDNFCPKFLSFVTQDTKALRELLR